MSSCRVCLPAPQESSWTLLTLIRLFLRYWFSIFEFRSAPAAAFAKFQGRRLRAPCKAGLAVLQPASLVVPQHPGVTLVG